MDPERIELDPEVLDALQRAQEDLEELDDDSSPEVAAMPEIPAAAGQPDALEPQPLPDFTQDVVAPEVVAPEIDDEDARVVLDEIPDLPAAPKPTAWQIRNNQVPAQPQQPIAPPAAANQPRQQPAQPVAPNFEEFQRVAQEVGAIDNNDEAPNWDRAFPQVDAKPADNDLPAAKKEQDDRLLSVLDLLTEGFRDTSMRLAALETKVQEIINGNQRRKR
jgi:hypothetical protein